MTIKLLSILLIIASFTTFAQVGIGTTAPEGALDVVSTNSGIILSRVANTSDITTPIDGMIVFDVGEKAFKGYSNGVWKDFTKAVGSTVCGAFTAPGVFINFMCHNLGADPNLDPDIPVQGIHGNYYQWGSSNIVADATTPTVYDDSYGTWNTTNSPAALPFWEVTPCPVGYRLPTNMEWIAVRDNNTLSKTGSFINNGNFTSAFHWGPDATTKTLTLPASGRRSETDGTLTNLGNEGSYWSSTNFPAFNIAWFLFLQIDGNNDPISSIGSDNYFRARPLRCISE